MAIFPEVWDHITKTVFSKYFLLFSTQNSRMSRNMYIWRHKLCNAKTGVGPTFTWSNEPWYMAPYVLGVSGETTQNSCFAKCLAKISTNPIEPLADNFRQQLFLWILLQLTHYDLRIEFRPAVAVLCLRIAEPWAHT